MDWTEGALTAADMARTQALNDRPWNLNKGVLRAKRTTFQKVNSASQLSIPASVELAMFTE